MTSVYVVQDEDGLLGVYSSSANTEEAIKRFGGGYVSIEMELDAMPELIDGMYGWYVELDHGKNATLVSNFNLVDGFNDDEDSVVCWWDDCNSRHQEKRRFNCKFLAATEEDAIEIARNHWFPCPPFESHPVDPHAIVMPLLMEHILQDGTIEMLNRIKKRNDEENLRCEKEINEWLSEDR